MRPHRRLERSPRARLAFLACLLVTPACLALPAAAEPSPARIAVAPFRVHSARPLAHLEGSLADLLASRLAASGRLRALEPAVVREASREAVGADADEAALRRLAQQLAADRVVVGSVTELAGRFSLDVRMISVAPEVASQTWVLTAQGDEELLDRVNELAERIVGSVAGAEGTRVAEVRIEGAETLAPELRERLRTRRGETYDAAAARDDAALLRAQPGVAAVSVDAQPGPSGVVVRFQVVAAERLFAAPQAEVPGERVAEIQVRGNRRIEADAIRARVTTKPGDPYRPAQIAADVRAVFGLGFFRDVRVLLGDGIDGRIVIFEVEENPVVRQVSITGNDEIAADKIRDALTLTTGSTLDYPLVLENRERIAALYRAEGYYLAKVNERIEPLGQDGVAVAFEVQENAKLRLEEIRFEGNQRFSAAELRRGLKTKPWRFWSPVTHYLDRSGTYSEPVFMQDLRSVEQKYSDAGYLQVSLGEPRVEPVEGGLVVTIEVKEGDQYRVGKLDVAGDDTVDVAALREKLDLEEGEIFNRSHLTSDVDKLTRHYTDRGFYFAHVDPRTQLDETTKQVDVTFEVTRGSLYFIREVDVAGNTTTVDPVIRREMQLVEGQLYSARAVDQSRLRVQNLGFFEEVNFDMRPTDVPGQLDLGVKVVERPTGSLSFGAGFSSQDSFVFTGSLAQSNLFGRGLSAQLSADVGGRTSRFYLSLGDPYFLGSSFGVSGTVFSTDVQFEDFDEKRQGVDFSIGHALNEQNTARGFVGYTFSLRELDESTNVNAASLIFREILQGETSTSQLGLSFRADDLDDRIAPRKGYQLGSSLEFAGLGGFAQFLRAEAKAAWYLPSPGWFPLKSTFVLSGRVGWTVPFNSIADYDFGNLLGGDLCIPGRLDQVCTLDHVDRDLELPLTERYFLGGLGTFQLRGFRARSVGPRRAVLRRSAISGTGDLFAPVGRDTATGACDDFAVGATRPDGSVQLVNNQGNGNQQCNDIDDEKISDFEDLDETDVIGGNKFLSLTVEYRFPISEALGLVGIVFLDTGNAFSENESLFDVGLWRYGTGVGALWFSPFGPLQAFWGLPLDPLSVEDASVFEFSVGGANF